MALISRKSWYTGEVNVRSIPLSVAEVDRFDKGDNSVLYGLSSDDVQFLKLGVTPEEWANDVEDYSDFDNEGVNW